MKQRILIGSVLLVVAAGVLGAMTGSATARIRVAVSSSIDGTKLADGSRISGTVIWTASTSGASVTKIVFLVDGTPRWTENYSPYRFNGDPDGVLDTKTLTDGAHKLAVVAYARGGGTVTDKSSVMVSNNPAGSALAVSSSIANGSTLSGTLTWTASTRGTSAQKVVFSIDQVPRWTENSSPYQFNGDPGGVLDTTTLAAGSHVLTVTAYAGNGSTANAQSTVTVSNQSGPGSQAYPNAPTDLHIVDSSQQTSLTAGWTKVTGASGYRVGRNGVALADTTGTTYAWTGLQCGTTYTLSVQPETSTKDTRGQVATVAGTTASCNSPAGGNPVSGGGAGGTGSGSVVFDGDLETGTISQYESTSMGGAQCANYGVDGNSYATRGNLRIVSDVVAKGSYAGRFDLPASGNASACELLRGRTVAMDDEWYSMEVRFPDNWQEPSSYGWGMSLAQLNFQDIWGGPLTMIAHAKSLDLILNSGLCSSSSCQYTSGDGGNVPSLHLLTASNFSTGVWHQFLIHVKWTNGNDGVVETFHRVRGETAWTQTAKVSGYPTLQRTSSFVPDAGTKTVDKIGAYRGPAGYPLSIWQDNFCQATSMAAAQTCF